MAIGGSGIGRERRDRGGPCLWFHFFLRMSGYSGVVQKPQEHKGGCEEAKRSGMGACFPIWLASVFTYQLPQFKRGTEVKFWPA